MAFIRKRTTKNGVVSTALVEAYRSGGKPKHRIIANLHGATTLAEAVGRLAAKRDRLKKERAALAADEPHVRELLQAVHENTYVRGITYTGDELRKVKRLQRQANRLLRRLPEIDAEIDQINIEGGMIKKHCIATADEIRAEAAKYVKQFDDDEARELAVKIMGSKRGRAMLNKLANG